MKLTEKEKRNGQTVSIWLEQKYAERLDRIAAKAGITRSKLLANLVEVGLDEIEVCDKTGILYLAVVARNFQESIRGAIARARTRPAEA